MSRAPSSASGRRREDRLPAEVTSFVGRRHETAEVRRLLSAARLVTLTGVGGVGKTRLALSVAAHVRRAFPDGVWLVELAEVRDPERLIGSVAEALPARSRPLPSLAALADAVRDQQALLILDNCEHLLAGCAVLVETLLHAAPALCVLATSRQPLGIRGEQLLVVPALPLPAENGATAALRSVADNDSVRLFTERARAVLPDFTVTEGNRSAVSALCRRLDGVPLELELAAGRLRALSVQQLLDRLGDGRHDRFHLLTAGPRALPRRHQRLRALIDWSHGLCTPKERLLWARASVFAGGLDLAAAEAVCCGAGIDRGDVIDLVTGLVDKSVLTRTEDATGVRYDLLTSAREYGRELLAAAGAEATLLCRHRDYYAGLSAEVAPEAFGPAPARLELDHANLHAALERCLAEPGQPPVALRMAADLLYHWIRCGAIGEGRRLLDLALAADAGPPALRARALWAAGLLALTQADTGPVTALLEQVNTLAEQPGQGPARGYAALLAGMLAMYGEDRASALAHHADAALLHRMTGDRAGLAVTLVRLSLARCVLGDAPGAMDAARECLRLCAAHGASRHHAYAVTALGVAVWRQGDPARGAALVKEGLRAHRCLGDRPGTGLGLAALAWVAAAHGRYERAALLLGALRNLAQVSGARLSGFAELAGFHEVCEAAARRHLGGAAFRTALGQGARLSYDRALDYALRDRDAAPDLGGADAGEWPEPSSLTPRETEIAELVAKGLSNRQIAAALTIALRTAEGHIGHILTKLGFTSRTQIAVWESERKLEPAGAPYVRKSPL
jgi:predicted ATPase/DNA-binding CsgD family transcriptional regulator